MFIILEVEDNQIKVCKICIGRNDAAGQLESIATHFIALKEGIERSQDAFTIADNYTGHYLRKSGPTNIEVMLRDVETVRGWFGTTVNAHDKLVKKYTIVEYSEESEVKVAAPVERRETMQDQFLQELKNALLRRGVYSEVPPHEDNSVLVRIESALGI